MPQTSVLPDPIRCRNFRVTETPATPWYRLLFSSRMLICIYTGAISGLPLYLLLQLLPAWLRKEGVSLADIGLFALVGFPYNWKFVWAPLLDRYALPWLGRRRGWMLVFQLLLAASVACIGFVPVTEALWTVAAVAVVVALFSASLDIVVDAYRRELLSDRELGLGNSIHVQAYRLASLIPGSLGVILGDFLPWSSVFVIMAGFVAAGAALAFVVTELPAAPPRKQGLLATVIEPFRDFVQRLGWSRVLAVIAFVFLYKLGDSMATALSTPFYIDLGFSLSEIGSIAKVASLSASIVGAMIGGISMLWLGINRGLWLFGLLQALAIMGFYVLSLVGNNPYWLAVVIAVEYLGVGMGTAALTAFIARTTALQYAASQLALLTAIAALPRTFINAATGFLVEAVGWSTFFLISTALAIPGLVLLWWVAPWNGDDQPSH
jgi:MFS transporter, PAT family, beta-lactamase induction signal transducer AmpG